MIIKLKASIVCDNCGTEVACSVPMEFDRAEWSSRFKRPEIPDGVVSIGSERLGYLCAECAKNAGYTDYDYDGGG